MDRNQLQPGDVVGEPMIPRAHIVKQSSPALGSVVLASLLSFPAPIMADDVRPPKMKRAVRPLAYSVEMTDPPCLQPRSTKGEESALQRLAASDVLLLGKQSREYSCYFVVVDAVQCNVVCIYCY